MQARKNSGTSTMPTVVAALYTAPQIAIPVAVVAALGCLGEVAVTEPAAGLRPDYSFAAVASALMIGFAAAVSVLFNRIRTEKDILNAATS